MQPLKPRWCVYADAPAVGEAAAEAFMALVKASAPGKRLLVALSGGATPMHLYRALANDGRSLPWERIHVFWSDERLVPLDDPESNFRLAHEELLAHVPIPKTNIHPAPVHLPDPAAAAQHYTETLFQTAQCRHPRFTCVFLGMGPDGHTASLFPGHPAVRLCDRPVAAVENATKPPPRRITFTLPLLNAAEQVFFMVTGADKAAMVPRALYGPLLPMHCPAGAVRPRYGEVTWLLDRQAAGMLPSRSSLHSS